MRCLRIQDFTKRQLKYFHFFNGTKIALVIQPIPIPTGRYKLYCNDGKEDCWWEFCQNDKMFSFELRIDKDVEPPRLAGEVRISADRNVYEYFTFGDHEENDYQLRAGYNVLQLKPRQLSLISIPGYIWSADNLYRVNVGEESDLQIDVTLYHRLCNYSQYDPHRWGNVSPLMRRCRTVYCSKNQTCEAAETREENKDDNPKSHESKNEKLEENKIEYIIYDMFRTINPASKTMRRMTTPTSGRTTSSRAQTSLIRQSHYSYRHYYKMFDFSYARPPFPGGGG